MTRVLRLYRELIFYTVVVLGGFTALLLAGIRLTDISLFETYGNVMSMFCVIFPALMISNSWATANLAMSFGARRASCFWSLEVVGLLLVAFFVGITVLLTNLAASPEVAPVRLYTIPVLVIPSISQVQVVLFIMQMSKGRLRNVIWGVTWCAGWFLGMGIELVCLFDDVPAFFSPVALTTPFWAIVCLVFAVPGIVFGVLARRGMERAVVQL